MAQGIWQPSIRVSVEFHADDFKTVRGHPDLCTDCIYGLLDDLARTLMPTDEALKKIADAEYDKERARIEMKRQEAAARSNSEEIQMRAGDVGPLNGEQAGH